MEYPTARAERDIRLTPQALRLYGLLIDAGHAQGFVRATQGAMARALEVNERAISRGLLRLETYGYIKREHGASTRNGMLVHLIRCDV